MLELEAVSVAYNGIVALQDVELSLSRGEAVAVLGLNGAGKSTLVNAIAGLIPCSAGSLIFDGRDMSGWGMQRKIREGVILVPEGRQVFSALSVRDHILLGARARPERPSREEYEEAVSEGLQLFPALAARLDQRAGTLSGGQQQMVALARALAARPRLMLLDEPSLGLAPVIVDVVFAALERIRTSTGMSILLVEQEVTAALQFAQTAYVLRQGRVAFSGSSRELQTAGVLQELYFGS